MTTTHRLGLIAIVLAATALLIARRLVDFARLLPAEPRSAQLVEKPVSNMRVLTPILIDTDIGTDIDDAFALALEIRSPELELLGVTTVSGDTQARARLAAKLLWDSGLQFVPVAAGRPGKPLPKEQTRFADGFASPQLQTEPAVELLRSQIDQRPGKITLDAIGPLTNVAELITQYPVTARKLKRIVLMGGSIAHGYGTSLTPAAEYNIVSDPKAAQTVFTSGIPILIVPLDATAMLDLNAANRHRVFTHLTTLTNDLTILYHLWNNETPILFDPMTIALLIDPSVCETKELYVQVDDRGFTRVVPGKPPNATVALKADTAKFFDLYLRRVAP
ncbi:MAG TPA: nucleoside hydrolase [Terriglobia bacterium]|nr:nucleoside hydrolase [Terriglobia bacterium]